MTRERLLNDIPISSQVIQNLLIRIENEDLSSDDIEIDIYKIRGHLRYEKYGENGTDKEILTNTINAFESCFPNWQREYKIIYQSIENLFKE